MARISFVVAIYFLLLSTLAGCQDSVAQFPMHQPTDNISKIELLENVAPIGEPIEFSVVFEIPKESYDEFIDLLLSMECSKAFGDRPTEFGVLAIRITYTNGDIEMIGHANNAYFTANRDYYGAYYFYYEDFKELFSHYVDKSLLPDI